MQLTCETCAGGFSSDRRRRYCARPCRPSERPFVPAPGEVPATGDRAEIIGLVWAAARRGSVAAMQLLRDEFGREGKGAAAGSIIDELADRRRRTQR